MRLAHAQPATEQQVHAGVWMEAPASPRRRDVVRLLLLAERAMIVITMMGLGAAVLPAVRSLLGLREGVYDSGIIYKAVLFPLYAVHLVLALAMPRRILVAAARRPALLGLVAMTVASVAWSEDPGQTIRRSVIIVLTMVVGLYWTARFEREELLRLLAVTCGISAVLSVLWSLGAPNDGVMLVDDVPAWLGVFGHKNVLGRFMVMSTLLFLLLARRPGRRWLPIAFALLSLALIALSRSASALLVLVVLLAAMPLFALWMSRHRAAFLVLAVAVMLAGVAALLLYANSTTVFTWLGKDTTLTGRTGLWAAVWSSIQEHYWLGYGYGAFWTGWEGASRTLLETVDWEAPHAHNGILDLWLSIGAIGVGFFVVGYVAAFARALAVARAEQTWYAVWPLLFLSFMFLYNLTESTILREHSLFWVLYVVVVTSTPSMRTRARPAS